MSKILLIILEAICEAIYFSLFLIVGKKIKNKRILFICLMIIEYLIITRLIKYNVWIHILYIAISYIDLKILYKEKAQITDIFLFLAASIVLIIISILCAIIAFKINNYYIALILNRILSFTFIYIFKDKIYNLYVRFYSCWNRHKDTHKIRSLTLRNISIILFNITFWVLNVLLIICVNTYKV